MDGSRIIEPSLTEVEVPDELVRRFAERAADHDRRGEIGFDNLEDLREAGLLALAVPRSRGEAGSPCVRLRKSLPVSRRVIPPQH